MKKNLLIGLLITFLTLGFVGISSADVIYPNELNVKSISITKNLDNYDIATIITKDEKCFMYQLKHANVVGFKTCDEKVWKPVGLK